MDERDPGRRCTHVSQHDDRFLLACPECIKPSLAAAYAAGAQAMREAAITLVGRIPCRCETDADDLAQHQDECSWVAMDAIRALPTEPA